MSKGEFRSKVWVPSQQEIAAEHEWIQGQIEEVGENVLSGLIKSAVEVRKRAYKPYSDYSVGVALLGASGDVYTSCNAEAVTYTETDHAERSTITKAISEGELEKSGRKFIKVVVVSHPGESGPCGGCRQRIAEHSDNALIIDVDGEGGIQRITSAKTLLPYAFTPTHLGIE